MGKAEFKLTDRDMIEDALACQKLMALTYNWAVMESTGDEFRSDMLNILEEEHQLHSAIFKAMEERDWYKIEPAVADHVNRVKAAWDNMDLKIKF